MARSTMMMESGSRPGSGLVSWIREHPLRAYFALAFAGTWVVFSPIILSKVLGLFSLPDSAAVLLFILSTFTGPFVAALVVTNAIGGRPGLGKLFRRMVQWRVGIQWYLLVLLGYPALLYVGLTLAEGPGLLANPVESLPLLASAYLPNVVLGILMPGLGEETGWRGFALPRLERLYGPLLGSLVLGILHALWHLPAYLTPGFIQAGPFDPVIFVANSGAIIASTFLWTWLFNNARGSILFAMLFHAASNASLMLIGRLALAPFANTWAGLEIFGVAALAVIALTRGRLSYDPETMPEVD
ncbi:MAG TPA: type II CAAX endopeptidase family protein [Anaerolineales bacterium]